jgi:RNA polymerase sigma-70 factor (ECF subfamily)
LAQELVQQALTKIPYEYRSALVLKEIEGLSYQEIAEALKISIGTVESRIFRGRQMLKDILSKKGVFKNEM